jgi:hypothetical protein
MTLDHFKRLLDHLGSLIAVPLHLDDHFRCVLNINGQLDIYLEPHPSDLYLNIGTKLVHLLSGPFAERVFKNALIANGELFPQKGYFAFSSKNNHLILCATKYLPDLDAEELSDYLEAFIQKGLIWKRAIEQGYDRPDTF